MATLAEFLSIIIPAGLILFIGIKIYLKMSEGHPGWFSSFKDWLSEKTEPTRNKIDPMHEGSIRYSPG